MVELIPAIAPAIGDAGIGSFGCSPGLDVNCFLTVSYANNCKVVANREESQIERKQGSCSNSLEKRAPSLSV